MTTDGGSGTTPSAASAAKCVNPFVAVQPPFQVRVPVPSTRLPTVPKKTSAHSIENGLVT